MKKSALILGLFLFFSSMAAYAFVLIPAKWPQPSTTMYIGPMTGTSPNGITWKNAFTQAAASWRNNSKFDFLLSNTGVPRCSQTDLRNFVDFSSDTCDTAFGDSTLAVTLIFTPTTGATTEIVKTDILFNSAIAWDVYRGPLVIESIDFRRVAVHELGHALGLDHEETASAIMAAFISDLDIPTADDFNGVAAHYGGPITEPPPGDAPIVIALEEPAVSGISNGISNLRGWVVGLASIQKVELFVDNNFYSNVPVGSARADVASLFPQYPDSGNAGFSMAFPYYSLAPGSHTVLVRATDLNNNTQEASAIFNVVRFNQTASEFIEKSGVNVQGATASFPFANQIKIDNALLNGQAFSFQLEWEPAAQAFVVKQTTP